MKNIKFISGSWKIIDNIEILAQYVRSMKDNNIKVVLTNGCFDILHSGHVNYLRNAKSLGDVLIVGVNSDKSVKKLKGTSRPINKLDDRLNVLAALSSVDYLISFSDSTAEELIRKLQPNIYVKGGDYNYKNLPEYYVASELGVKVKFIDLTKGYSTSNLINKIQNIIPSKIQPGI